MKYILTGILAIVSLTLHAQQTKPATVKVKNWGSMAVYITDKFFAETSADIIKQIGENEFNWMKTHCSASGWPVNFSPVGLSEEDQLKFEQQRNKLTFFKIAAYQHKYNGELFDRYVVLRVPYESNKLWDEKISWEKSFYFIIKEEDIEEIK